MRPIAQLTIQQPREGRHPVVLEWGPTGDVDRDELGLVARYDGSIEAAQLDALDDHDQPRPYGTALGELVFTGAIRAGFDRARGRHQSLLVLLGVEVGSIGRVRWEWLCVPDAGAWIHPQLDNRLGFARWMPSQADRPFAIIRRDQVRALIAIADGSNFDYHQLDEIVASDLEAALIPALGGVPYEVLSCAGGHPPTVESLVAKLGTAHFSILHVIAHGRVVDGEPTIYLTDEAGLFVRVPVAMLVDRLSSVRNLPSLAFLAVCNSDGAARDAVSARLIDRLGIPAVVAMSGGVTIRTATELAALSYPRVLADGYIEDALTHAGAILAGRGDALVPVLSTRLRGQRLFAMSENARARDVLALTEADVTRIRAWFDGGAPGRKGNLEEALRAVGAERIAAVSRLCEESLDADLLAILAAPPPPEPPCPFLGLKAFDLTTRARFFGREVLSEELADRVMRDGFVVIAGASGSGKSSLARAGILGVLRDRGQLAAEPLVLRPIAYSGAEFSAALAAAPAVVVIDQLEDVFVQAPVEGRRERARRALDAILSALPNRKIIATVRMEFLQDLYAHTGLRAPVEAALKLVAPLDEAELRAAIERQANSAGLVLEPELAIAALDEVRDSAAAMALVQHALRETWLERRGAWLDAIAYRATGGVAEALSQTADTFYIALSTDGAPSDQVLVREILLRLVVVGDNPDPTRRRDIRSRVPLAELVPAGVPIERVRTLVNGIADLVLVVIEEDHVEIVHDALLSQWRRMRGWIDEGHAAALSRARLTREARDWNVSRSPTLLVLRGERLRDIKLEVDQAALHPTVSEKDYLRECQAAEFHDLAQRRRLRVVSTVAVSVAVGVVLISLLLVGIWAWSERRDGSASGRLATHEFQISRARLEFAVADRHLATGDTIRALVASLRALVIAPDDDLARRGYYERTMFLAAGLPLPTSNVRIPAAMPGELDPTGTLLARIEDHSDMPMIYRRDGLDWVAVHLERPSMLRTAGTLRWSSKGTFLASEIETGGGDATNHFVVVWRAQTGRIEKSLNIGNSDRFVAFAGNESAFALRRIGAVELIPLSGSKKVQWSISEEVPDGMHVVGAPRNDGVRVAVFRRREADPGGKAPELTVVDLFPSGAIEHSPPARPTDEAILGAAISTSSERLVAVVRGVGGVYLRVWGVEGPARWMRMPSRIKETTESFAVAAFDTAGVTTIVIHDERTRTVHVAVDQAGKLAQHEFPPDTDLLARPDGNVLARFSSSNLLVNYRPYGSGMVSSEVLRWPTDMAIVAINAATGVVTLRSDAGRGFILSSGKSLVTSDDQKLPSRGKWVDDDRALLEFVGDRAVLVTGGRSKWTAPLVFGSAIAGTDIAHDTWSVWSEERLHVHRLADGKPIGRVPNLPRAPPGSASAYRNGVGCVQRDQPRGTVTCSSGLQVTNEGDEGIATLSGDGRHLLFDGGAGQFRMRAVTSGHANIRLSIAEGHVPWFQAAFAQGAIVLDAGRVSTRFATGSITWDPRGPILEPSHAPIVLERSVGANVTYSPDGRFTATSGEMVKVDEGEGWSTLDIRDLVTGSVVMTLLLVPGAHDVRFTSDGRSIQVLDTRGGRQVWPLYGDPATATWLTGLNATSGLASEPIDHELLRRLQAASSDPVIARLLPYVEDVVASTKSQ